MVLDQEGQDKGYSYIDQHKIGNRYLNIDSWQKVIERVEGWNIGRETDKTVTQEKMRKIKGLMQLYDHIHNEYLPLIIINLLTLGQISIIENSQFP